MRPSTPYAALVSFLLLPLLAEAAEPHACQKTDVRCITVLPIVSYAREDLWTPKEELSVDTKTVTAYLNTRLQVEPQLQLIDWTKLVQHLQHQNTGKLREAERLQREGEHYYNKGDLRRAVRSLEKAKRAYRDGYFDVLQPQQLADLLLMLAHARTELSTGDEKTNATERKQASRELTEMFFLDPHQSIRKGFYPKGFEELLEDALSDFRTSSLRRENRLGLKSRLQQFQRDSGAETVALPYIERDGESIQLRITVFDEVVATARFEGAVANADNADLRERLDRFISAWLTCLPSNVPVTEPPPPPTVFFIDTGFAYSIYGQFTTRRPFHNLGMGISVEYQFLQGLGVFGQVNLYTSTLDADRDLLDSFTSVRTSFGVSYAFRGDWWRVYVRFGFDIQFLGSYVTTTDPWCKFAGQADERCSETQFTDLGSGEVTMGFYGAFGAQFFVSKHIYIAFRMSTSAYIVPLNENTVVNFPFNGELSLGYSF